MGAVVQSAVECVLSLFSVGLVGYVLTKRGWFGTENKILIARLVTSVTLPPFMFVLILNTFDRKELLELFYGLMVPFFSILITFALGLLTAKLLSVPRGRFGLFATTFTSSNTIFMGLPVNLALFGEAAVPYVLLYFFAQTIFYWTLGVYCLSLDGGGQPEKIWSLGALKRLLSPPLLGLLIGVSFVMVDLNPPEFLFTAATYVGNLAVPLAMIFTGVGLAGIKLRQVNINRELLVLLAGRFIISPLVVVLLIQIIPTPQPLMAKVFIIQAALPVLANSSSAAAYYRSDTEYASLVVSVSTLLSLAVIPVCIVLISTFMP